MSNLKIIPSSLSGSIIIPPSKSHTLRAILFASLAHGQSIIRNYLPSPDTQAMIQACLQLGAKIEIQSDMLRIQGVAGKPQTPANIIDAGNSGQVFRFIAGIAALTPGYTVITGDHSIRHNRPIKPLLDALTQLNAFAVSSKENQSAPIIIKGPIQGGTTSLQGEDSQPVSALLIASAFAPKSTTIKVINPGETPWLNLTLDWFKRLGISYEQKDFSHFFISGSAQYEGFDYTVPGDFSSCAFPLIAALITGSELSLKNLDKNDVQGDKAILFILQEMGANIEFDDAQKSLHIKKSNPLKGKTIDVNAFIDAIPALAVLACYSQGETRLVNAAIARSKECDRLHCVKQELEKMGADIIEQPDSLIITPSPLNGTIVNSHQDHRLAMALAVAGLAAQGETTVNDAQCIEKSYPNFVESFKRIGAAIKQ